MPNGKPGDHPVNDIVNHGWAVFSKEIDSLVRELDGRVGRKDMWDLVDWFDPPPKEELETILRKKLAAVERIAKELGWEL